MKSATTKRRKRGRGGELERVLFVRADAVLHGAIERERGRRAAANPGLSISTASLVRALLWEALRDKH